jgi:CRP-like cAMP-binding protein
MIPGCGIHNFFDDLPCEIRAEFDRASRYRTVESGTAIVRIGDMHRHVHRLREGRVKYCAYDSHGRETITAIMSSGDWIGLTEPFTGKAAMANVVAISKVKLQSIDYQDFEAILDRHPVILRHLLRVFVSRFDFVYRIAQDRNELTLKERLLKLLHSLSRDGSEIAISQDDLAKMLAASRQALNRLLKELEEEGVLVRGYRSIRISRLGKGDHKYDHLFEDGEFQL